MGGAVATPVLRFSILHAIKNIGSPKRCGDNLTEYTTNKIERGDPNNNRTQAPRGELLNRAHALQRPLGGTTTIPIAAPFALSTSTQREHAPAHDLRRVVSTPPLNKNRENEREE
ncbi:hypothetical protein GSI_11133 [Ganoderma sinense ZZ0214-1]|uniref:Uncharacterized protein n=1 Tax=Ganoderma sinense ZZ0214-1 TaxID=1077348 RepID=A0A2G8RZ82_9APHY|nr:hypothetical protein GSI_11133 [Ganoderma sinense ZZ0214-1]